MCSVDNFGLIGQLTANEICSVNDSFRELLEELFPDLEVITFTLEKKQDRNAQLDHMIRVLEQLRESK